MSRYDNLRLLSSANAVANFVGGASPGDAAEYICNPTMVAHSEGSECRRVAWEFACRGLVTLFKRRKADRLQAIIVRVSADTVLKLGGPPVRHMERW